MELVEIENVELAKNGDKNSFNKLYQSCAKSLYITAVMILGNLHDAEDAVQDTAILAFNSLKSLQKNEFFKTWITKILINRCNRILSTRNKKRQKESDYEKNIENLCSEPISVETIALWDVVNSLKYEEKVLILLRFENDLSIKDISKILKSPEGTIKSKIHRTIEKLKKSLERE